MRSGKRRGENRRAQRRGRLWDEFWSRRPYFGEGKWGKTMTHRIERRRAKREAQKEASFRAMLTDMGYEKDYYYGQFKVERKTDEDE